MDSFNMFQLISQAWQLLIAIIAAHPHVLTSEMIWDQRRLLWCILMPMLWMHTHVYHLVVRAIHFLPSTDRGSIVVKGSDNGAVTRLSRHLKQTCFTASGWQSFPHFIAVFAAIILTLLKCTSFSVYSTNLQPFEAHWTVITHSSFGNPEVCKHAMACATKSDLTISYIEFPVNHQYTPNVSIYTSTMDPMGYTVVLDSQQSLIITYLDPADFHRFQCSLAATARRCASISFTYSPALIQQGSPEQRTKLQGTQCDTIYSVRSGFPDPTVFSFSVGKTRKT